MTFSNQELTLKELIAHNHIKFNGTEDFFNKIDAVLDLIKKDVFLLSVAKNVRFTDFNYFFDEAKKQAKQTFENQSKAFMRVFKCGDVAAAGEFIVVRVFNNMKNFSTNKNYKNYCYVAGIREIDYHIASEDGDYEMIDIENDLSKMSKEKMIAGFKKIYHNLDNFEFKKLCEKYNLNPVEVMGFDPSEMPEIEVQRSASGNNQLAFAF
jgi:hypothetical protein